MSDILASVALGSTTLLLVATAVLCGRWLFPRDSASELAIHVLVMSWGCIVATAVGLQLFRVLSPGNLLTAVFTTCVSAYFVLCARSRTTSIRPASTEPVRDCFDFAVSAAWTALALFGLTKVLRDTWLRFPSDWDSLAYHIPLVDHWIQNGSLYTPACAFWYVPGNSELIGYWLAGPFTGDFWIGLNTLPAVVLLALSVVKLLRLLSVPRLLRHTAAIAVVSNSIVWHQMGSNENDVAVAAMFLAGLWYGLRVAELRQVSDAVLCGVAFGTLCGTKYLALGYAGVVAASVIGGLMLHRRGTDVGWVSLCGVAGGFPLGGYWYVRNYLATGTPLFPKAILGGDDVWGAMRPESDSSSLLGSGRPVVWPMAWDAIVAKTGPIHVIALALLPAFILIFVTAAAHHDISQHRRRKRWWFLGVVLASFLVFVLTPNVVETSAGSLNMLKNQYHPVRLGFAAVSLLPLVLAVGMGDAVALSGLVFHSTKLHEKWTAAWTFPRWLVQKSHWEATALGIATVSLLAALRDQLLWQPVAEPDRAFLAVAAVVVVSAVAIRVAMLAVPARAIAGLTVIALVPLTEVRSVAWHKGFTDHYTVRFGTQLYSILADNDEPLCICDYRYYPFFGSRRQHRVYRPLWVPGIRELNQALKASGATLLVLRYSDSANQQRYAAVPAILEQHRECYTQLYGDAVYRCVRLNPERQIPEASAR